MFRVECPAELKLTIPPAIEPEAGAVIEGNDAGMRYLSAKQGREDLLAGRLADAAGECPR